MKVEFRFGLMLAMIDERKVPVYENGHVGVRIEQIPIDCLKNGLYMRVVEEGSWLELQRYIM